MDEQRSFKGRYVTVNTVRAREVFSVLAEEWRARKGIFQEVVFPEDRIDYPKEDRAKANWLFWMVHFMRGGIVSDDAINMFGIMAEMRPEMFDPRVLACVDSREVIALIRSANQERLMRLGKRVVATNSAHQIPLAFIPENAMSVREPSYRESFGRAYRRKTLPRDAGTIGYKLQEHAPNLIRNARVLCARFGGDARNFFRTSKGDIVSGFEEFFAQIDYKRHKERGIFGMRRKIAALLQVWFEKFSLIPSGLNCPLVVDFHLLRICYATGIISFTQEKPLVQSAARKNPYPKALLGKPMVRVTNALREEIMMWSADFLRGCKKEFTALELGMAMWILSRELCAEHPQAKSLENKTRYISYGELEHDPHLRAQYAPLCGFCPLEAHCRGIFSSGPHYEYGLLMLQERFPYRLNLLPGMEQFLKLQPSKSNKDRGARY